MGSFQSQDDVPKAVAAPVAVVQLNADPADFKKAVHAVFASSGAKGNTDTVALAKVMTWIVKYYADRKKDKNKKELPGMGILNKAIVKYGSPEELGKAIDGSSVGEGKVSEAGFMNFFVEETVGCPGALIEATDVCFFLHDSTNCGQVGQDDLLEQLEENPQYQELLQIDARDCPGGVDDKLEKILNDGGIEAISKGDFLGLYMLRRTGRRKAFKTRFEALAAQSEGKVTGAKLVQAIMDFPVSFGVKCGEKPKLVPMLARLKPDEEIDFAGYEKFMDTVKDVKAPEGKDFKSKEQCEANPKLLEVQRLWAAQDAQGEGKVTRKDFKEALEKQKKLYEDYKVPSTEGCVAVALTALGAIPNEPSLEWSKFRPAFTKANK